MDDSAAPYSVVDLFSGAGGFGLGLKNAGFTLRAAFDNWAPAVETYNRNLSNDAELTSLDWRTELPVSDLIVGGPPCQGFSSAGRRAPGDQRNTLVAVFAHLVARNRPRSFIFENVEGFLTGDGGRWVLDLLMPLVDAGYCISVRKVNAANYGVPQHRKRVIAVGGLGWSPGLPEPTHRAIGAPGAMNVASDCPLAPTLFEALQGLPAAVRNGAEPALADHSFTPSSDTDLMRIRALGQGQTMRDLPEELWHPTYMRRANRRVADGTPTERRGGAPAGLRRLRGDQPSKAVTSGAPSEFVHPVEDRLLTIRECARIQTFPDDFVFVGTKAERALQIGNAVPPRLAEAIARHVLQGLRLQGGGDMPPGLYEFTPTTSTGVSPALQRTIELVRLSLSQRDRIEQDTQPQLFGG